MINNISFNGHARINTKSPQEGQIQLRKALMNPEIAVAIKEELPDNVEIKYSSERHKYTYDSCAESGNHEYIDYKAELFKDGEKIGTVSPEKKQFTTNISEQAFINNFIKSSIDKCLLKLSIKEKSQHRNNILEKIKSTDGIII